MGGTTPSFDIGRADEGTLRDLVAVLLANNEALQSANAVLKDRLRALEKLVFGPRTEKIPPFDVKQPGLLPFPDFAALQEKAQEAAQAAAEQSVDVPAHKRKKHGRRADFCAANRNLGRNREGQHSLAGNRPPPGRGVRLAYRFDDGHLHQPNNRYGVSAVDPARSLRADSRLWARPRQYGARVWSQRRGLSGWRGAGYADHLL